MIYIRFCNLYCNLSFPRFTNLFGWLMISPNQRLDERAVNRSVGLESVYLDVETVEVRWGLNRKDCVLSIGPLGRNLPLVTRSKWDSCRSVVSINVCVSWLDCRSRHSSSVVVRCPLTEPKSLMRVTALGKIRSVRFPSGLTQPKTHRYISVRGWSGVGILLV